MQEKYEKAMISLAQMEKRAVMAESMLEATLQYESGQNKAHQSPGYINDSHNITLCLHVHSFLPRCPLFGIHHVFWIVTHKMDSCVFQDVWWSTSERLDTHNTCGKCRQKRLISHFVIQEWLIYFGYYIVRYFTLKGDRWLSSVGK